MVLKSDKEKVKTLLSETIRLLCKNGLPFRTEFSIEALVGITLDKEDEFFLSIREIVKSDIVTSTDMTEEEVPSPKKARRREKEGQPRKRSAATVTARSQGDVTNLSLGDMQDSAQSFWGSVTDGESQQPPLKMRHVDDSDDDSDNEAQVTIKGEPGSDSDLEVTSHETPDRKPEMTTQQQFVYNVPSQSQMSMPQSGWDQMGQFTSMAGTSGMNTSQGATPGMDGQQAQAMMTTSPLSASSVVRSLMNQIPSMQQQQQQTQQDVKPGPSPSDLRQQRLEHLQKDPYYIPRLMRRVLLTKGREVTPKQVYWNYSYKDRPSCSLIHEVMKELHEKGMGVYGKSERKTTFTKKEPWSVAMMLVAYGINIDRYEKQYYANDVESPPTRSVSRTAPTTSTPSAASPMSAISPMPPTTCQLTVPAAQLIMTSQMQTSNQLPTGVQLPMGVQIPHGMQVPHGVQIPPGVHMPVVSQPLTSQPTNLTIHGAQLPTTTADTYFHQRP